MTEAADTRSDVIVIGAGFSGVYTGRIPEYRRRRCDEIAAGGYTGFKLA
ncbi:MULTISPECIES: hypothetical protein [unclassified Mycobacterium]|nr:MULTISPECIES: hypothetical protein [unclassified Mycobacterium]